MMATIRLYRRSDGDLYEAVEGSQTDRILAAMADFRLIVAEVTPEAGQDDKRAAAEVAPRGLKRNSESRI